MQRYAGKNDPNEYVDNGLHIPIDPVNYRITYLYRTFLNTE